MKEVFTEMDPKNIESEYLNEEAPRGGTQCQTACRQIRLQRKVDKKNDKQ